VPVQPQSDAAPDLLVRDCEGAVGHLDDAARLSAPDNSTWFGRRYQTLLTLAVQTGQRISQLTRLARHDITWAPGHTFVATARDRKDRATPLPAHT
jgi:integrase